MTIFYPDVYSGQAGISFHGAPVAMVKATQGTGYVNPDFSPARARAASAGAYFCGYHFLAAGNGKGQAGYAHSVAGSIPLMLDFEPVTGSDPSVADALAFIDEYRSLGGTCTLLYFPRWYWQELGSPSLSGFISRKMNLVSSDYITYTDDGPGWAPYGGMTPQVWQYTETATFNGYNPVDFNAYKGTIEEFKAMAEGTSPIPAPAGLKIAGVALTVSWDAVPGESSYVISAVQLNGKAVDTQTVTGTSAILSGLVHGWTYDITVEAAQGNAAAATLKVTA